MTVDPEPTGCLQTLLLLITGFFAPFFVLQSAPTTPPPLIPAESAYVIAWELVPPQGVTVTDAELTAAADALDRRLSLLGVVNYSTAIADGIITVQADDSVDVQGIRTALAGTDLLEFVDFSAVPMDEDPTGTLIATTGQEAAGVSFPEAQLAADGAPYPTVLTGADVESAGARLDDFSDIWVIDLAFTPEAANTLASFTGANIGMRMGIVLNGEVLSAPTIQAQFGAGAIITGNFSEDETRTLAAQLSTTLPVPLMILSEVQIAR